MKQLTGRDPRTGHSLELSFGDGLIVSIGEGPPEETCWLSAGLIDLQVNGYRGYDLNAETLSPQTVIDLAMSMLPTGVTTFLPTLITQSEERLVAALHAIAQARNADPQVAHMIPGIHIEGPSLSQEDGPRGAHPREHIRPPSLAEFKRWQQASNGLVRLVTLSPHHEGSSLYIAELRAQGVHVSIGHTHSTPEEIHLAAGAGANLSTHLGNGLASSLPRHPNMVWAQLADDRLTAMFIADGHHLPADTLSVMLRAKSFDRSILVSDVVALGGLPPGSYKAPIGGDVELSPQGRLSMAGTSYLAGAALPLKEGIRNVMRMTGASLFQALTLATLNPGRFLTSSLPQQRGILGVGAPADVFRFSLETDGTLNVNTVLLQGQEQ